MLHILLLTEGILTICECRGPHNDPGGDGKLVMLTGVLHTRHYMLALPQSYLGLGPGSNSMSKRGWKVAAAF